jgi:hypothetical protein
VLSCLATSALLKEDTKGIDAHIANWSSFRPFGLVIIAGIIIIIVVVFTQGMDCIGLYNTCFFSQI